MEFAEARSCIEMGDMLGEARRDIRGLRLDPARMARNLDLGHGLIMAEAVMLDLGDTIGRQHAHDVVYERRRRRSWRGASVRRSADGDSRVTEHLDASAIAGLLDPTKYTGLCAEMAREAAVRARTGPPRVPAARSGSHARRLQRNMRVPGLRHSGTICHLSECRP